MADEKVKEAIAEALESFRLELRNCRMKLHFLKLVDHDSLPKNLIEEIKLISIESKTVAENLEWLESLDRSDNVETRHLRKFWNNLNNTRE